MPYGMKCSPNADVKTLADLFEPDGKTLRKRDVHSGGITVARFGSVVGIVVPRADGSVFVVETSLKLLGDAVDKMRAAQEKELAAAQTPAAD